MMICKNLFMEKIKEITQLILNIFKIISITCPTIGIIIFTFYCMEVHFIPPDVQISDTLVFILITISFGMLYASFVGVLYWANLAIFFFLYVSRVKSRPNIYYNEIKSYKFKNYKLKGIPSLSDRRIIYIFGVIAEIILLLSMYSGVFYFPKIILVQFLMLLIYAGKFFYNNHIIIKTKRTVNQNIEKKKPEKNEKVKFNLMFILLLFFTPLVVGQFSNNLIKYSLAFYGIRQIDVSLYVDKNYFNLVLQKKINKLNSQKSESDLKNPCDDNMCELEHIDILFTNVGSKTLIFIPSIENKTKGLRVELPNSAIKLNLKDYSQSN
ncbi:hypothetical protein BGI15_07930 [Snodgrassella alvi]|nr:hypothetical protein BGI07_08140 [Snodgrassella alvi]ORF33470.1 hypothetical protein BGI11_08660 [Snodgrassella alvi]ORF38671.1 hypothetical protein BGI13_05735 [Snodgrassella alvi]ORF42566.1 hypothetical protein BGI15_07930 [Snodgrassella alvi]PCL21109.1 hypothetical protein CPT77_04215 [Snodgrassella alvi]